jgi:adenine phosphoribosyltransferase
MVQGNSMDFGSVIRSIPDYPKPGIIFRDITTLLGHPRAFRRAVDELVQPYAGVRIDKVAGIEARGFILGGAVAHQLSVGFIPVRKKGKLPWQVLGEDYALEYGIDRVEIHTDAVNRGEQILLIDDLIATGGTCFAAIKLLERAGGKVVGCSFVIDLPDLGGADKIRALGKDVIALVAFEGH